MKTLRSRICLKTAEIHLTGNRMKKFVALFIIGLAMSVSTFTQAAVYGGGSGTSGDPYQIWTAEQMNTIGANPADWDKHFKLMADIAMSAYTGTQYNVIGNKTTPFTGIFDGGRHFIMNLTYINTVAAYVGLFGYTAGSAVIQNLGVEYASLSVSGAAGVLAGHNSGTIQSCYVTGSVSGEYDLGGLAGRNTGTINFCYAAVSVNGTGNTAGGLVGYNPGWISNCYATGAVTGNNYVGGLVGFHDGFRLSSCYATGTVIGTTNVGGLVGFLYTPATACFWDTVTSSTTDGVGNQNPDPSGVAGKTTLEMQTLSTFTAAGWDFSTTDGDAADWFMLNDYPRLDWQFLYAGGRGIADDPYQIWTPEQMNTIGTRSQDWDKYFVLMADIDMSAYTGTQYNIIGNGTTPFTGTFNGNSHVISGLTYTGAVRYIGLFGYSSGAIYNLNLKNVSISSVSEQVGGLVGYNSFGTITACSVTGSVSGTGSSVGGLVGENNYSSIMSCYASVIVNGNFLVGGLVGYNYNGILTNCYAIGSSIGIEGIGGLVGRIAGTDSRLTACYSTGSASGTSAIGGLVGDMYWGALTSCYAMGAASGLSYIGGLVGWNGDGTITSCYAAGSVSGAGNYVGGLVGYNNSSITASFWDTQTSGQPASAGGIGLTTEFMQKRVIYLIYGWDFAGEVGNGMEDTWTLNCEAMNYPKLAWQISAAADWFCPDGVGPEELLYFSYYWLADNCYNRGDCGGVDLDYSGNVDMNDWAIFADQWLEGI